MHRTYNAVILFAALALIGCAGNATRCAANSEDMISDVLYLGMAMSSGVVTPVDWERFLSDVVTPRFSKGFSTWQAAGQWRSDGGEIVHEASHVLAVIHPADAASERAMREIAAAYKSEFRQEAILRVTNRACVSLIAN